MTLEPRLVRRARESSIMNHFSQLCAFATKPLRLEANSPQPIRESTLNQFRPNANGGSRDPKWLELTLCER